MSSELPTLAELRGGLYSAVVSDALDGLGYRRQSPQFPRGEAFPVRTASGRVLLGRCRTTLWGDLAHEDPRPYALELAAVDDCRPDDVLICAAGGSLRSGIWGELLTTAACNRGCVGAVVDGAVRDVARIRALDFPVFAAGVCVYDSLHRQRVVDRDVPVEVGGVTIRSGDWVIADEDGVVVIPGEVRDDALRRAWEKVHAENRTRDAIRAGMGAAEAYARFGVL